MARIAGWLACVAMCVAPGVQAQELAPARAAAITPPTVSLPSPAILTLRRDTAVRLMVLNEVSTKTARPGDRFVLRVDQPVQIDGVTVIPVGASAVGEVTAAKESGAVGRAGRLSAKLLHVTVDGREIALTGDSASAGPGGATQAVLGIVGLGLLGLLARGTNAKLKAGEMFVGYVAQDTPVDPAGAPAIALSSATN